MNIDEELCLLGRETNVEEIKSMRDFLMPMSYVMLKEKLCRKVSELSLKRLCDPREHIIPIRETMLVPATPIPDLTPLLALLCTTAPPNLGREGHHVEEQRMFQM